MVEIDRASSWKFSRKQNDKLVQAHTMGEVSHGKIGCGVTVECEPSEDRYGIGEMDS